MAVSVIYSDDALRQLKKLTPTLARRIVVKIGENARQSDPLCRAKALQGRLRGKYRYRIGDYRAVFMFKDTGEIAVLMVLAVQHRKDIYR